MARDPSSYRKNPPTQVPSVLYPNSWVWFQGVNQFSTAVPFWAQNNLNLEPDTCFCKLNYNVKEGAGLIAEAKPRPTPSVLSAAPAVL